MKPLPGIYWIENSGECSCVIVRLCIGPHRFTFVLRLVSSETDFQIGLDTKLVPADISYEQWKGFMVSFISRLEVHSSHLAGCRFEYGELRLSRLNTLRLGMAGFSPRSVAYGFMHWIVALSTPPFYKQ
ncbi:hypothetical protein B0I35DRAFT_156734 [Stachybotrys elegans]|uniref:Uncharacterized protein n=1 Tax=Stachybotrys elegans TaxID=80388 RepID=A0A8K0WJT4_9HYPO|nr:hypothetical protein B0I35DRAFT_156734 [Stachybotrys elegans]